MFAFAGCGLFEVAHAAGFLLYLVYADGNGGRLVEVESGGPEAVFNENLGEIYRFDGLFGAAGAGGESQKEENAFLHIQSSFIFSSSHFKRWMQKLRSSSTSAS